MIKYKTDQAADVKKVEKLNNEFFKLMSLKRLDPASLAAQEGAHCIRPGRNRLRAFGLGLKSVSRRARCLVLCRRACSKGTGGYRCKQEEEDQQAELSEA